MVKKIDYITLDMYSRYIMNTIVRVALLFKNPSAVELIQLNNLIWVGKSLEQQDIVIQMPETMAISSTKVENLRLIGQLERVIAKNVKPS